MANATMVTSNPLGRWWHPLPLTSGIGLMIGFIVMKLTGMMDDFSWWFVILCPLISDILVNVLIVGAYSLFCWIADKRDARRKKRK